MNARSRLPMMALLLMVFLCIPRLEAQLLKKLGKKAERAAERTVERRVERETEKKTDAALDSILEPGSGRNAPSKENVPVAGNDPPPPRQTGTGNENPGMNNPENSGAIEIYSKFDFVPGDTPIFYDDFSKDFIGDFPSKWNTNGSGEVVTLSNATGKWLAMVPGYSTYYIPDVPALPEEYTIEFDVMATGLDQKTSSTAIMRVMLSDDPLFKSGNYAAADIPFCQYHPVGFHVRNSRGDINNNIQGDIRKAVMNQPHISIAVNKERFRLWVNESKYIDIPRMIPVDQNLSTLKFEVINFKDGKERIFIKDLKVAEGGVDLRRKLLSEGAVSTNGIMFVSGSAEIQPQSMGIIRQVSQVLQEDNTMNLLIIGHTDSDGADAANLALSKQRADAVRDILVEVYGVAPARLATEGKGESEPVASNDTPDGKAQNRRVEFKKQS
ncbi:OmpA family protein [Zeaxanthinibacter enoshimensis]|uniref:OmpA family protein n=1 Tax=Zeaxanthinibacter enoshimensis TaxID=392009 RepID=A0A4V3D491_9FLAO|nr:OmpA family protein [Zeaxanthinibacter enoshimensis]TDQ33421.1 OmpA family protein [Zeaxanthinibacter enoshimensis]